MSPMGAILPPLMTGLSIVEHKTVSGINREFAATTDQSCLNRWLTEAPWEVEQINQHRLECVNFGIS